MEWDRPWYEPIPDSRLINWVEYCSNDVVSTEKVFYYLEDDYESRLILAKLAGGTPNDTTNSLTIKLLTHRTDMMADDYPGTNWASYIAAFNKVKG